MSINLKSRTRNSIHPYARPARRLAQDRSRALKEEKSAPRLSCISLPGSAQPPPPSSLAEEDDEIILYPRAKRARTDAHEMDSPSADDTSSPPPRYIDENIGPLVIEFYKDTAPRPEDDEHDPGFVIWTDGGMNIPPPEERCDRRPFAVLYQDEPQEVFEMDEPLGVLLPSSLLLDSESPASCAGEISPIVTPRLMGFTSNQQSLFETLTQY